MSNGILTGNTLGVGDAMNTLSALNCLMNPVACAAGKVASATYRAGSTAVDTGGQAVQTVTNTTTPIVAEAQTNFFSSRAALYLAVIIGGALLYSVAKRKQQRKNPSRRRYRSNPREWHYNRPGYRYYVMTHGVLHHPKIASGWEYREDAKDACVLVSHTVLTAKGLKKYGLDPDRNSDWLSGDDPNMARPNKSVRSNLRSR